MKHSAPNFLVWQQLAKLKGSLIKEMGKFIKTLWLPRHPLPTPRLFQEILVIFLGSFCALLIGL